MQYLYTEKQYFTTTQENVVVLNQAKADCVQDPSRWQADLRRETEQTELWG
jgi:hypothetical protein